MEFQSIIQDMGINSRGNVSSTKKKKYKLPALNGLSIIKNCVRSSNKACVSYRIFSLPDIDSYQN